MMAHNFSPHALSSALGHLSSGSFVNPDPHLAPTRQVSNMLSMPEMLEAFQQPHPSSSNSANNGFNNNLSSSHHGFAGNLATTSSQLRSVASEDWELPSLPELKWLDQGDNAMPSVPNLSVDNDKFPYSALCLDSRYPLDESGERWPFSGLYPRDRVATNGPIPSTAVDDSIAQFSLQAMVTPSPASSGSSVFTKHNRVLSSMPGNNNLSSSFATSVGYPIISANSHHAPAPEWRSTTPTTTGSSSGSHKRQAQTKRPDLDLSLEEPNLDRTRYKVGALETSSDKLYFPERSLVPSTEVSVLTGGSPTCQPAKRSRHHPPQSCEASVILKNDPRSSPGPTGTILQKSDQKVGGTERGSLQTTLNDQTGLDSLRGDDSEKQVAVQGAAASDHEIHIWTERERRKKMNGMFSTLHSLLPHLTSKADKSTIVDEAINYIQSLEMTMKGLLKRKDDSSSSSILPSSLAQLQAAAQTQSQNGSCLATADTGDKYSPPSLGFCGDAKPTPTQSGSSSPTSTGESYFQTRSSPNVVLNVCGMDAFISICSSRGRSGLLCRILFALDNHNLNVRNAHISTTDDTILYMLHAQTIDSSELANPEVLNKALQDLTNCVTTQHS